MASTSGLFNGAAWPAPPVHGLTTRPTSMPHYPFAQRLEMLRQRRGNHPGSPFGHGSGAGFVSPASQSPTAVGRAQVRARRTRSNSPGRDGPDRQRTQYVPRPNPVGPQEETEWLDALAAVQAQVQTIERIQRDHAAHMTKQDDMIETMKGVIERHDKVLTEERAKHIERNRVWVEETFPAFEKMCCPLILFEQLPRQL